MKERDAKIRDLEVEIAVARSEVVRMKVELSTRIETVRNQTFGYGYGAGLQCLISFLVANLDSDVSSFSLEDLKLDPISRQQLACKGLDLMPGASPSSDHQTSI